MACSARVLDIFIGGMGRGPALSASGRLHPRNLSRRTTQITQSSLSYGRIQGSRSISSGADGGRKASKAPTNPAASGDSGESSEHGGTSDSQPNDARTQTSSAAKAKGTRAPKAVRMRGREAMKPRKKEHWQIQKEALEAKFGDEAWSPRKRLSPDALEGIRAIHAQYPDKFTTPVLAQQFKVSPEAIRRILKSKWRPNEQEEEDRLRRWDKRGEKIWSNMVELGVKPPKKWRMMGIGKAEPGQIPKWKKRGKPSPLRQGEDIPWDVQPAWTDDVSEAPSIGDRIL